MVIILHCEKWSIYELRRGKQLRPRQNKESKLKHRKIMKLLMALPFPFRLVRFSGAVKRRLNREEEGVVDPYDATRLIPKNKIRKWIGK